MVECQCRGVYLYDFGEVSELSAGSGSAGALRPVSHFGQISQQWSAVLGSCGDLCTINDRINQMESLLQQVHCEPHGDVPVVVQFDGIWLREQTQTEIVKLDNRRRQRQKRMGKKVVLLVALGLWTDGSGKRAILDLQVANGENKATRKPFVHRL
jgi:hypothetical protein